MMTLAQASSYFDKTPVTDPYTGSVLFYAQIEPFDDAKRDAYTAYRRTMSVAPGTVIPAHKTLRLLGGDWMVGTPQSDGLATAHRQKYVVSEVLDTLKVSSLGEFLAGTAPRQTMASPYWAKDEAQIGTSSDRPQLFDIVLPSEVGPSSVLWSTTSAFLSLSAQRGPTGLFSSNCLKLTAPKETCTLVKRVFSPATGGFTETPQAPFQALRVRWQSLFEYLSQSTERYQEGDVSLVVPDTADVATADLLQLGIQRYSNLGVRALSGAKVVHCRRA
jgi:hypothetical protein